MIEKIDTKYFKFPNWRNGDGEIHFREVTGRYDNNNSLVRNLNTDSARHKKLLQEIPYASILSLDKETYGDGVYLAERAERKIDHLNEVKIYDILTRDGVVIGRFYYDFVSEMYRNHSYVPRDNNRGAFLPSGGVRLPKEKLVDGNKVSLDDIISSYCTKNAEAKEYIPKQTFNKFPKLSKKINEKENASQNKGKNSDGGRV